MIEANSPASRNDLGALRDVDIRLALRAKLRALHDDEPDTAIIDELGLAQGQARVDMAAPILDS